MVVTIELILGLLIVVVLLTAAAGRLQVPSAILLVLGGLLLSFVPAIPTVSLEPDLVLTLFLPPLIYASAWQTSWREFRASLRPILLLSVGLVLATTTLVAVVAHYAAGLDWPIAFVLGAIVSPTDAVAASATLQSLGLSPRVVTILEGESMVNDATGLVVYRFAVAAVVSGAFSLWDASLQFMLVSMGGLLLGLIVAWPLARLHRAIDDAPIEITITLLTPFAAYLLADTLGLSGVLATLSAGLYLSRQSARFFSSNTRLQANAVWNILVFLLNGLLFLLIGLQLRAILTGIAGAPLPAIAWHALILCAAVIAIRIAWVFSATYLPRALSPRLRRADLPPGWRNVLLVAWSGLRGGLSLAAAFALPVGMRDDTPFPARQQIIFLTFCVILATLVLQGIGLAPLIRLLGIRPDHTPEQERSLARQTALRAALARLDALSAEERAPNELIADLRSYYEDRLWRATGVLRIERHDQDARARQQLHHDILAAERAAVIQLRDQGKIDDEVLRAIERELDLEEQRRQG